MWWLVPVFFKNGIEETLRFFQAPLWQTALSLGDWQRYWMLKTHEREDLCEAIKDLSRQNHALNLQVQMLEAKQAEAQALATLWNLPALTGFDYKVARVTRRDVTNWWERLEINLGMDHGIQVGMGVVCQTGVVGKVVQAYAKQAFIELITSPSFRMVAHLTHDSRPLAYQGIPKQWFEAPYGMALHVPIDPPATNGPLKLVSSHLGGAFPKGLLIGEIADIQTDPNGLFRTAKVLLPEALTELQEVGILIPRASTTVL